MVYRREMASNLPLHSFDHALFRFCAAENLKLEMVNVYLDVRRSALGFAPPHIVALFDRAGQKGKGCLL